MAQLFIVGSRKASRLEVQEEPMFPFESGGQKRASGMCEGGQAGGILLLGEESAFLFYCDL